MEESRCRYLFLQGLPWARCIPLLKVTAPLKVALSQRLFLPVLWPFRWQQPKLFLAPNTTLFLTVFLWSAYIFVNNPFRPPHGPELYYFECVFCFLQENGMEENAKFIILIMFFIKLVYRKIRFPEDSKERKKRFQQWHDGFASHRYPIICTNSPLVDMWIVFFSLLLFKGL